MAILHPPLERWSLEIEGMPQFDMAMQRVEALYQNEIIDRPPIRFQAHNAFLNVATEEIETLTKDEKKAWWFDAELQVDLFVQSIDGRHFHGETFPVYFSSLISPEFFLEFGLPILEREVKSMTHNIFHIDGSGVAKHLDAILSVPEIHALQWVQGVGDDYPIMQWVSFIKEYQAKGIPMVIDLAKEDIVHFIDVMDPEGLFLWVATECEDEEIKILKYIEKWT